MNTIRTGSILFLLAVTATAGCYTRLTTPKETVRYINKDGSLAEPSRAVAIYAPEYMKAVRALTAGVTESVYRIPAGMLLDIQVYGVPELSKTLTVRPDGFIDYPMLGEVKVAARTIADVKRDLVTGLSRYYESPQVMLNAVTPKEGGQLRTGTCSVISISGRAFMRLQSQSGGGGSSGVHALRGDERLFEVVSSSLSGDSAWDEIATIRQGKNETNLIIISSLENFVRNGELDENIPVLDGDVVFVPMQENTWLEEIVASIRVVNAVASDIDGLIDLGLEDRSEVRK